MRNLSRARTIAITLLSGFFAFATPEQAQAQDAIITGKVAAAAGQPLSGVNVYITDLALSVATNAEGNYTITIPSARCCGQLVNLRVRALGYRPEVRPIRVATGRTTIDFTMQQDVNRLDEIVVTAQKRSERLQDTPISVSALTADVIERRDISDIAALSSPHEPGGEDDACVGALGRARRHEHHQPATRRLDGPLDRLHEQQVVQRDARFDRRVVDRLRLESVFELTRIRVFLILDIQGRDAGNLNRLAVLHQ